MFLQGGESACPEAAPASTLELQRLQTTLVKLPRACREAFLLNRVEVLSHVEIARRFGVSVRTIDRYMARATAYLRETLGSR